MRGVSHWWSYVATTFGRRARSGSRTRFRSGAHAGLRAAAAVHAFATERAPVIAATEHAPVVASAAFVAGAGRCCMVATSVRKNQSTEQPRARALRRIYAAHGAAARTQPRASQARWLRGAAPRLRR